MHFNAKHENNSYQRTRFRSTQAQRRSLKDSHHSHENVSRYWGMPAHWIRVGQTILPFARRDCRKSQLPFGQDQDQKHVNQSGQKGNIRYRNKEHYRNRHLGQVRSHGWLSWQRWSHSDQNVHEWYRVGAFIRKYPQQAHCKVLDQLGAVGRRWQKVLQANWNNNLQKAVIFIYLTRWIDWSTYRIF